MPFLEEIAVMGAISTTFERVWVFATAQEMEGECEDKISRLKTTRWEDRGPKEDNVFRDAEQRG